MHPLSQMHYVLAHTHEHFVLSVLFSDQKRVHELCMSLELFVPRWTSDVMDG